MSLCSYEVVGVVVFISYSWILGEIVVVVGAAVEGSSISISKVKIYADQLFVRGLHPRLFEPPHRWYMSYLHPSYSPDCCIISSLSLTIVCLFFRPSSTKSCCLHGNTLPHGQRNALSMVTKKSPCGPKVVSMLSKSCLEFSPKFSQS